MQHFLKMAKRLSLHLVFVSCLGISVTASFVDVTMVLPRVIFPANRPSMVRCVAEEKYELEIEVQANIGNGEELPPDSVIGNIEPEDWPGLQMEIPKASGAKRFGAFSCSARDNATDITRKAVGVVVPTSARVFPMMSTYRTTMGEPLEMEMLQPRPEKYDELMWYQMHPGRPRMLTGGELTTTIEDPQPDQTGLYVVLYPTRDFNARLYQQAVFRIIVRACPSDKFGPICQEECLDCKNGGVCDMDDGTCICAAGFGGATCEKICGANTFGPDCQYQCDENPEIGCKGKMFCRPDPLGCTCASGFSGVVCNGKCGLGKYGINCESECHCARGACDPITGKCIDGSCAAGWMGENCQETCPPFSHGPDCKISCGVCYGDLSCNRTTGECPGARAIEVDEGSAFYSLEMEHVEMDEDEDVVYYCDYGYASPICDEPCHNGTWWKDCVRECHCMGGVACNPKNGECDPASANETAGSCAAGWLGVSCDERCENGTHGILCKDTCGSCAGGSPCNSETGHCEHPGSEGELCIPGFVPPLCKEVCPEGYFGVNCASPCRCHNVTVCEPVDGACEDLCATGYQGLGCQENCNNGSYGLGCVGECGMCRDKVPCNVFNGSCVDGCMLGWAGESCHNATLCDEYECQNNATCVQMDSIYRCECQPGYAGGHCEKKMPPCHSTPCQNQGMCMEVDVDEYICQCFFSYSGKNCEVFIEGMSRNNFSDLHAAIAALVAIALVLAIVGILAYKCRAKEMERLKGADCENGLYGNQGGSKYPRMHARREGSIKLPKRFRGKAHPKTVVLQAGNRRIRVSRKMLGKSSLFSDGSSCHLSRMNTASLFQIYDQPTGEDTKRGFLNQCNQEPLSLSKKQKQTGFDHNLSTDYPNVTRNEWLDQDHRWGGISRAKHIKDSPHPLRSNARNKASRNIKMPAGVPLSDYRSLITQARNADEEFEMEVRRDRKQAPYSNPHHIPDISGNEYQRRADRARRRTRPRPKTNKERQAMPKINEETTYPPPSVGVASPFHSRNRVADGQPSTAKHHDKRLAQSVNARARYRNSIPNVQSTQNEQGNSRSARRKHSNRKNSHRKSQHRRRPQKKEHGSDDEF